MFKFDNSYSRLPENFYERIDPIAVKNPKLIRFNKLLAEEIGLEPIKDNNHLETIFSGNVLPKDSDPIALAYAGHQFGHFVPQLGDGRAVLLGEVSNHDGFRFDIQLKGSGPTSFSRGGDGRAPLGPVIREYIMSEAMHFLNIPTTRSLAMVATDELVSRETLLPGGVLTRIASSHIRVGTFEYFAAQGDQKNLKLLADYAINRHYSNIDESNNRYQIFLESVCDKQASLIAKWMEVGFIHGVMNTDNTSISGETIDYGPCAFMDSYHPETVFSSIDHHGRYAYGNQPNIGQWNLARLSECLLPLIDNDSNKAITIAEEILDSFGRKFEDYWFNGMCEKIGLPGSKKNNRALLQDLLKLMQKNQSDFTLTFWYLSQYIENQSCDLKKQFTSNNEIDSWLIKWEKALKQEKKTKTKIKESMLKVNPAYIPRNHQVEKAIYEALNNYDYSYMDRLTLLLEKPYDYKPENIEFMMPPENGDQNYQTFCGT